MVRERKPTAEMHSKELQLLTTIPHNEERHKTNITSLIPKKENENEIVEELFFDFKVEENDVQQCRGCRTEGSYGLFSIHEEGLKDLFLLLTGIEIKDDDPAPNFFCEFCRSQLMNFSLFRSTCIESHSYFVEKMNEKLLAAETKKEIFVDTMPIISEEETDIGPVKIFCNGCPKKFQRRCFLWHWRYTHSVDKKPSKCRRCHKKFPSKYHHEEHQRKEHGILKCFKCKRDYTDPSNPQRATSNLIRHIRRCDNFEEYKEKRVRIKKPTNSYDKHQCNECMQIVQRRRFVWHWRYTHLVDRKPSTCGKCQQTFSSIYKLEEHQRVEHGLLKCCICDHVYAECSKSIRDVYNLLRHIRRCDNMDEYKIVPGEMSMASKKPYIKCKRGADRLACPDCSKKIPRKRFRWHWCYVHQVDEESSACVECGKVVESVYKLEEHHRIKHDLLKCNLCNNREPLHSKDPKIVANFLIHMNKHCSGLLVSKDEEIEMETIEAFEKQFETQKITCNDCKKKFFRSKFLWHWRYEHAVDKKKSFCRECKESFSSAYKLEKHQRIEHKIFRCYKCDTSYNNSTLSWDRACNNLQRHIRKCDGYYEYRQSRKMPDAPKDR